MVNNSLPFKAFFFKTKCSNLQCGKKLIVTLSKQMLAYGFYCPFCKKITPADTMFELILEYDKAVNCNGEN